MGDHRALMYIVIINIIMSLFVSCLSPRFDIVTLMLLIISNTVLFFMLLVREKNKHEIIKRKIDDTFALLHELNSESDNYEVIDDEFGKLRDEIVKVIQENKIIAAKAEKDEQILREYTEDIAHQIKTPLTRFLLMLDLMEEDKENNREYISRLRNDIDRLNQLVDVLLKLAALDSGTIHMKIEGVSIKSLVKDIGEDMEVYFDECEIHIIGNDFTLSCDKKWTYEAVFNIVKNGIEASDNNKLEIYLSETKLYKSIIVKDFGRGLSEDMLQKAYKRFYKAVPNSKGYGIGLPMAKSIMEKQNGELLYVKGKSSNTFELRFYN